MRSLINKYFTLGDDFNKNVLTLVTGSAISQFIPLLVTPILTRIYSPGEFGILATFLSITSICGVIATGRYEMAIMLPSKDKDAINLVGLSLLITLIYSLALLLIVLLFKANIANMLGESELRKWLYFVPLVVALMGMYQAFNFWTNRKKRYKCIATANIFRSSFQAGGKLGFGSIGFTSIGLISGVIIGQLVASFYLLISYFKNDLFTLKFMSRSVIRSTAREYIKFPKYDLPAAALNSLSTNITSIVLILYFGRIIVGYFSLAYTLLALPIAFVGYAIGQVYFQRAHVLKNNKQELRDFTYLLYKRLVILGIIPIAIISSYGDFIFEFVLGKEWLIAGKYAMLLSTWLFFVFLSSPLSYIINVFQKQHVSLLFNALFFISQLSILFVGGEFISNPLIIIALLGIAGTVLRSIFTFYLLKMVNVNYINSISYTFVILISTVGILLLSRYIFIGSFPVF